MLKSKMKTISGLLSIIMLFVLCVASMTACGAKDAVPGPQGVQGEQGEPGKDGVDGESPCVGENGNWWVGNIDTGVYAYANDGKNGTNGINGKDGKDGADGVDGEDGVTPLFSFDTTTNILSVSYDSGETWSPMIDLNGMCRDGKDGVDGQDGTDGKDGADGKNGIDGKDGVNGITPILSINEVTDYWMVSYDGGSTWISLNVCATGEKGDSGLDGVDGKDGKNGVDGTDGTDGKDGKDGKDGVSPLVQINLETFNWEISLDNGKTWQDTGVSAVGKNGSAGAAGKDGKDGEPGKDGETPEIFIENDKLCVKYPSTEKTVVYDFSSVTDVKDGVTPLLRINTDTYAWEVSYDNGATWDDLGVSALGKSGKDGADGAKGEDGKPGADGEDGKTPNLTVIGDVLYVYYDNEDDRVELFDFSDISAADGTGGSDGKDGITPRLRIEEGYWQVSYDNGNTWESLGVKATGEDGNDGAPGKDGVNGTDGAPGVDGKDGKDGEDGRGIKQIRLSGGYIIVEYTDGYIETVGYVGNGESGSESSGSGAAEVDVCTDALDFYPLNNGAEYGVMIGRAIYMTRIEIPEIYNGKPVTTILERAFEGGAELLEEVIIPSTVKEIRAYAFYGCMKLEVSIPESVERIGDFAFANVPCVSVYATVSEIEGNAFSGVGSLTIIGADEIPEGWPELDSETTVIFKNEND